MCKQPITIKNKSKYISYQNGMAYEVQIECGRCSECRRARSDEYILRTIYQAKETFLKGGYLYFDTLTYDNKHLPRLSKFLESSNFNRGCFKYEDIREFYERLRSYYRKEQEQEIKYFITAEYGSLKGRPHYHALLFITDASIKPIELSRNVAKAWKNGRTDGEPYKGGRYTMEHNVITNVNIDAFTYIAKYVNKSVEFTEYLDKKWESIERIYKLKGKDRLTIKRYRGIFYRHLQPFHRQSQHYGEYAIEAIGIDYITQNNKMYYRTNTQQIVRFTQIRPYFKRKLFQKQKEVNGKKIWVYTEAGKAWKRQQEENNIKLIADRLEAMNETRHVTDNATIHKIAEYIYLYRQRTTRPTYEDASETAEQYQYGSDKDAQYLGYNTISETWAGNDKTGYYTTAITKSKLKEEKIIVNKKYEKIIQQLTETDNNDNKTIKLLEHLQQVHKMQY